PDDRSGVENRRQWKCGPLGRTAAHQPFRDVIEASPTRQRRREIAPHPSLKPQAFLRKIVRAALPLSEGVILGPFAGAGSTLAACEHVGCTSIGVEMDERYGEIARTAIPQLAAYPAASNR